MPSIDDLIKEALTEQESEIIKCTEELGYFSLAIGLFSGKLGWVSWVIILVQGALFVAGAWAAWQFFAATDLLVVLKWGLSGAVLILMTGRMKMSLRRWPRFARWRRGNGVVGVSVVRAPLCDMRACQMRKGCSAARVQPCKAGQWQTRRIGS